MTDWNILWEETAAARLRAVERAVTQGGADDLTAIARVLHVTTQTLRNWAADCQEMDRLLQKIPSRMC